MIVAPVLVVDDDQDIRETVIEALGDEDVDAIGAADGQEALDLLLAGARPAVVFLDLMMPRMSGADFLRARRNDAALAAIPVVLFSADAEVVATAAALGATEAFRKPIKLDVLVATALRYVRATVDSSGPSR